MKIEELIIPIVCECFHIDRDDLIGGTRRIDHSLPRHALTHLIKKNSLYSDYTIAKVTGRSHGSGTIGNSIISARDHYRKNPQFRAMYNMCMDKLKAVIRDNKSFELRNIDDDNNYSIINNMTQNGLIT